MTRIEGSLATNGGAANDIENHPFTYSASIGTVTDDGGGFWSWSYQTTDGPAESQTVTIFAQDSLGAIGSTTFTLNVNNAAPTATFVNSSGTIREGGVAALSFSDQTDASVTDINIGFLYSYDCTNDGSFELADSSSSAFNCPYNTADTYTARGRIADKDGGFSDYTEQVVVNPVSINRPPQIAPDQSEVTVNEGSPATNAGTAGDPDGDTITLTVSIGDLISTADGSWSWNFTPTDGPVQSQTVTLTADDGLSGIETTSFDLTVNNVAPTAVLTNLTGPIIAGDSTMLAFNAAFDPGVEDVTAGFLFSYDCAGDGTLDAPPATPPSFTCSYPAEGTFNAVGRIQDKDGGFTDYSVQVVVNPVTVNRPPVVTPDQTTILVSEEQPAVNSGMVSDPDGDVVNLTASIGTVINNGDGTWGWAYTPDDGPSESQTVTISADDGSGGVAQMTFSLAVNNLPPVATLMALPGTTNVGGSVMLTFANPSDPSSADTAAGFLYLYDCAGDGTFDTPANMTPAFPCTYPSVGTFNAVGRIQDKDGGFTDYVATVNVVPINDPAASSGVLKELELSIFM